MLAPTLPTLVSRARGECCLQHTEVCLYSNGAVVFDCGYCFKVFTSFRGLKNHPCFVNDLRAKGEWTRWIPSDLREAARRYNALSADERQHLAKPIPLVSTDAVCDAERVDNIEGFRVCKHCSAVFSSTKKASLHIQRQQGKDIHPTVARFDTEHQPLGAASGLGVLVCEGQYRLFSLGNSRSADSGDNFYATGMLASICKLKRRRTSSAEESTESTSKPPQTFANLQALMRGSDARSAHTAIAATMDARLQRPAHLKPQVYDAFLQHYFGQEALSPQGVQEMVRQVAALRAPGDAAVFSAYGFLWDGEWLYQQSVHIQRLTFEGNRVAPSIKEAMCKFMLEDPSAATGALSAPVHSLREVKTESTLRRYCIDAMHPFLLYFILRFPETANALLEEPSGSADTNISRVSFVLKVCDHLLSLEHETSVSAMLVDFLRIVGLRLSTGPSKESAQVHLPSLGSLQRVLSGLLYLLRLLGIALPYMLQQLDSRATVLARAQAPLLIDVARHKAQIRKTHDKAKIKHCEVEPWVDADGEIAGVSVQNQLSTFAEIGNVATEFATKAKQELISALCQQLQNVHGLDKARVVALTKSLFFAPTAAALELANDDTGVVTSWMRSARDDPSFRQAAALLHQRKQGQLVWVQYPLLRQCVVFALVALHVRLCLTTRAHEFKTLANESTGTSVKPWGLRYDITYHTFVIKFFPSKFQCPGSEGVGLEKQIDADTACLLLAISTVFGPVSAAELEDIDFAAEFKTLLEPRKLGNVEQQRQVSVQIFEALKQCHRLSVDVRGVAHNIAMAFAHSEATHDSTHYADSSGRGSALVFVEARRRILKLTNVELPRRVLSASSLSGAVLRLDNQWRLELVRFVQPATTWAQSVNVPAGTRAAIVAILDSRWEQVYVNLPCNSAKTSLVCALVLAQRGYAAQHVESEPRVVVYVVPTKELAFQVQCGYWFNTTMTRRISSFVFNHGDLVLSPTPALEHEVVIMCSSAFMTRQCQSWLRANHHRISRVVWDESHKLVVDYGWQENIGTIKCDAAVGHVFLSGTTPQSLVKAIQRRVPFSALVGSSTRLTELNRTVVSSPGNFSVVRPTISVAVKVLTATGLASAANLTQPATLSGAGLTRDAEAQALLAIFTESHQSYFAPDVLEDGSFKYTAQVSVLTKIDAVELAERLQVLFTRAGLPGRVVSAHAEKTEDYKRFVAGSSDIRVLIATSFCFTGTNQPSTNLVVSLNEWSALDMIQTLNRGGRQVYDAAYVFVWSPMAWVRAGLGQQGWRRQQQEASSFFVGDAELVSRAEYFLGPQSVKHWFEARSCKVVYLNALVTSPTFPRFNRSLYCGRCEFCREGTHADNISAATAADLTAEANAAVQQTVTESVAYLASVDAKRREMTEKVNIVESFHRLLFALCLFCDKAECDGNGAMCGRGRGHAGHAAVLDHLCSLCDRSRENHGQTQNFNNFLRCCQSNKVSVCGTCFLSNTGYACRVFGEEPQEHLQKCRERFGSTRALSSVLPLLERPHSSRHLFRKDKFRGFYLWVVRIAGMTQYTDDVFVRLAEGQLGEDLIYASRTLWHIVPVATNTQTIDRRLRDELVAVFRRYGVGGA